jgi:uncharacterized protein YhbP (UPF0306 family)
MDNNIIDFLEKQTCASICCLDEHNRPWCFTCFFIFNPSEGLLYFKSSAGANHVSMMKKIPMVAGTVLPDKLNKLRIRGAQFDGVILDSMDRLTLGASQSYHKRNPLALAMPGEVWTIQVNQIKLTDSAKGFGRKTTWSRQNRCIVNNN